MIYVFIFLFLLMILLINTVFFKQFTPSYVAVMFWSIQIIICLICIDEEGFSCFDGLGWIWFVLFFCMIFGLSAERKNIQKSKYLSLINVTVAKKCVILQCWLSYFCVILNILNHGFDFESVFSLNALAQANNEMAVNRYSGLDTGGGIAQLFLPFVYSSCLSAGYFGGICRSNSLKVMIFSIIPSVLIIFSLNTKAVFLCSVIFLSVGFFVGCHNSGYSIRLNCRYKLILLVSCIVFISIMIFSMMLRIGSLDTYTLNIVLNKLWSYSLGHIPAFCSWIDSNIGSDLYLGEKTFLGPLSFLGVSERLPGVYSEFWTNGIIGTNVYTYFRGFVEDFGVIGGAIVFILFIKFGDYAYSSVTYSKYINMWTSILSFVYCFVLLWVVSIATYTSLVISFFIFYLFLRTASMKNVER